MNFVGIKYFQSVKNIFEETLNVFLKVFIAAWRVVNEGDNLFINNLFIDQRDIHFAMVIPNYKK